MRSTKKLMGCVGLVLVAGALAPWALNKLYFVKLPSENDISLETAQKLVAKDLGTSSSRAQVEAWLKSNGIEYAYANSKEEDFNYSSPAVDSGIPIKSIGEIIFAKIPNTERGLVAKWDIKIVFFFNKKGKILTYTMEKTSTGF